MDKRVWRWATPKDHDASHDSRQVEYWLSRPLAERLARAEQCRHLVAGEHRLDRTAWRWGALADLDQR